MRLGLLFVKFRENKCIVVFITSVNYKMEKLTKNKKTDMMYFVQNL